MRKSSILFFIIILCICCCYWASIKKFVQLEPFTSNICDYYTGIGPDGCATKSYCTTCDSKNRNECSTCRNCVYVNNTCVPGDFYGPYNQKIDYEYYEYDIPYDFSIPNRRQTDLRYDYKYKII